MRQRTGVGCRGGGQRFDSTQEAGQRLPKEGIRDFRVFLHVEDVEEEEEEPGASAATQGSDKMEEAAIPKLGAVWPLAFRASKTPTLSFLGRSRLFLDEERKAMMIPLTLLYAQQNNRALWSYLVASNRVHGRGKADSVASH